MRQVLHVGWKRGSERQRCGLPQINRVTKDFSSKPSGMKRAWPALRLQMSPLRACTCVFHHSDLIVRAAFILRIELLLQQGTEIQRRPPSPAPFVCHTTDSTCWVRRLTICRSNTTGGEHRLSDGQSSNVCDVQSPQVLILGRVFIPSMSGEVCLTSAQQPLLNWFD